MTTNQEIPAPVAQELRELLEFSTNWKQDAGRSLELAKKPWATRPAGTPKSRSESYSKGFLDGGSNYADHVEAVLRRLLGEPKPELREKTCWVLPDTVCPQCHADVGTDGRSKWCMNQCGWKISG